MTDREPESRAASERAKEIAEGWEGGILGPSLWMVGSLAVGALLGSMVGLAAWRLFELSGRVEIRPFGVAPEKEIAGYLGFAIALAFWWACWGLWHARRKP